MTEEEEEEKQKRIHSIKNLYAFELFCQHRFDDSMQIFVKLGTGKDSHGWDRMVIRFTTTCAISGYHH
jgi:hypothetical protein